MYQYDELRDLYTFVCGQALTISPVRIKDGCVMCPIRGAWVGVGVQVANLCGDSRSALSRGQLMDDP